MKKCKISILLFFAVIWAVPSVGQCQSDTTLENRQAGQQAKAEQVRNTSVKAVPDLTQTLKSANFAGGGSQFCGPVAVSNSLVWLEGKPKDQSYQIEMVKKLSSREYMNTKTSNGTGTTELMRGVKQYAEETWSQYNRLEYAGWRSCLKGSRVADKPTIEWIVDGIHDKSAVWINVGWYVSKGEKDELTFERVGGHWLTVVGHSNGKLFLHDPAPRGGMKPKKEKAKYEILESGLQTGKKRGLPLDAKGSIALTKGMRISKKADTALIDGAVIFELESAEPFRKWTSQDGKFSVNAKLLEIKSKQVKLATKEQRKRIEIEIKKLSDADHEYLQNRSSKAAQLLRRSK